MSRVILSYSWHGQAMIPLFQFDRARMRPRPDVLAVIRELRDDGNDREVAVWFATPNAWLEDHARPVALLDRDTAAVMCAAQSDRQRVRGCPLDLSGERRD